MSKIDDAVGITLQRHLIYSWARCRGNLFILAHFRCSPTVVGPPSPSPQRMAAPSWATSEVETAGRPGDGTSEREIGGMESIFYYKQQYFTPSPDGHRDTLRLHGASVQGEVHFTDVH